MGNTLEILQLRLVKASIMKVVFVLFVAMATVEMNFALKCNFGESQGKDNFFVSFPCKASAQECVGLKINRNGKTKYQAACYQGDFTNTVLCNQKYTNFKIAGVTWNEIDVCCCKGDNCNDIAHVKSC